MSNKQDNMTKKQSDMAVFLPALSSFFAGYVGKQRHWEYVDNNRVPAGLENNVESLNWLNAQKGCFTYKWSLYSAGHANLDVNVHDPKEDMIRNRDRENTIVVGDSGGFQIGKGVWTGDWKDPNCPLASKKRKDVLAWLDSYMDYGMILDIPAWVARSPKGQAATGVTSYIEAVNATKINNDYFIANRNGNCKFLNVLQGENHTEAEDWYQQMKGYCDPKQYSNHFNGWSFGGQNMCDIHLTLKRLVALRFDGLLESGKQDWLHFLGTSKLEWALLLTDIQRAIRKYHNPTATISFDCASPFLATANGQIYIYNRMDPRTKWTYTMKPSVDDKKYATDNRKFSDALLQDGIFNNFLDSPVSDRLKIKDVCIYNVGDLNKIGKEGRTSWDSFSYALQMAHNVWSHINAVQVANNLYDNNATPSMLIEDTFEHKTFKDVIDRIFEYDDRDKALDEIEKHNTLWLQIIGTRGLTGKKTINSSTAISQLFSFVDEEGVEEAIVTEEDLDEDKLEDLEEQFDDSIDTNNNNTAKCKK